MFNKNNDKELEQIKKCETSIKELETNNKIKLAEIEANHKIELKEKDFQLKHFESEQMKSLAEKIVQLEKDKAVLQKEKEMLDKITDLNADVIDVKDLVKNLINKLPEVKISNLSVQASEAKK